MKRAVGCCLFVLAVAGSACQPVQESGPPSETVVKQIEQRVPEYFKKTADLPATVVIKVVDVKPALVPNLLSATLELTQGTQTQRYPITLTRDGRYVIQGPMADLSVDPYKANMDKITLKDLPPRGNENAGVTIVAYSDFQCPFCAKAYSTIEDQLLKEYGDKVRLYFKNFPLSNIHPWAESAALASICARQQSPQGFWKMYDFFFLNQKDITPANVKEKAEGVIRDAGLDVAKFDDCFDNKTAMGTLKAEMDEATSLNVRSTPTFFVNGRKLQGAVPYDQFKAAVDAALGGGAAPTATTAAG